MPIKLYIKVDVWYDKLALVIGQTKLMTCDGWNAVAKFFCKSRKMDKVAQGSVIIFGDIQIS